jgi:N-acetylneuraminic acid mutarotase
MKIKALPAALIICLLFIFFQSNAQYVWRHRACFPGAARAGGVSFVLGNNAYIVGGDLEFSDNGIAEVWEYSEADDSWTPKNDFPTIITGASAFVINDTAYVGLGSGTGDGGPYYSSFYRYDASNDQWIAVHGFPGTARYTAMAFAIGEQGYITCGKATGFLSDTWAYNPDSDSWTQVADFPGGIRGDGFAATTENFAYVGLGNGPNGTYYNDSYQYGATSNMWTSIANFPDNQKANMACFVIDSTIYLGGGNNSTEILSDCWSYASASNSWVLQPGFSCVALQRRSPSSFVINGHGYIYGGVTDASGDFANDLLEFGPLDTAFTEQVNVLGNDTSYCGSFNRQLSVSDSCAVWSTGEEASQINISSPGTYWVRINDSCGVSSDTIVITQTSILVGDSITNATCGLNNGSAGIFVLGGVSPYSFLWNNGDSTAEVSGLSAGDYVVTVTDITNCSSAIGIAVNSNVFPAGEISLSQSADTLTCYTGVAFQWYANGNKLNGDTNAVFIAPGPGDYYVVISDSNGCSEQSDIIQILGAGISNITADDNIHIYPNPLSNSNVILEVNQTLLGSHAQIFDIKGSIVNELNIETIKTDLNLELEAGVYIVRIASGNNTVIGKIVKL